RERERALEGMLARRLGDPREALDHAARSDGDEVVRERLAGLGIGLDRRADHLAAAADPEQAPVAQTREEFSDHRTDGAGVRILEDVLAGGKRHGKGAYAVEARRRKRIRLTALPREA